MKKLLYLFFLFFNSITSIGQGIEIGAGLATGVAVDRIKVGLDRVVDKSLDRADYSVAQAALTALGIIDAWKESNKELLDVAFGELDKQTSKMLGGMVAIVNKFNNGMEKNLQTALEISENATQISESIPLSGNRSFILRYTPTVLNPNIEEKVLITLKGVNLDRSDPKLALKDGTPIEMKILGPKEVSFWYPITELDRKKNKTKIHEIEISHTTRDGRTWYYWPKYKEVKRTLLITTLPLEVGTYELNGVRSYNKEERTMHTVNIGTLSGRNTNVFGIASPPEGYLWDLRGGISSRSKFSVRTTGRGEKGRCEKLVWNGSGKNGIKLQARCDEINNGYRRKDGYINCGVHGPIYRNVPVKEKIETIEGIVHWSKDESIKIPKDLSSFELKLKLYNGVERTITDFFSNEILEVTKGKERINIRSTPPKILIK